MTTDKRNKIIYGICKIGGVVVSCIFPIWAICERFPMWTETHGASRSLGVGGILALSVLAIIFRKSVFKYLSDKFKLQHTPPIFAWIVMLVASYVLMYIASFLRDLTTILWMGLLGCGIGTLVTFVGENFFSEKKEEKDG